MASEAGKGDKRRPTNDKAFESNFDAIFGEKKSIRGSFVWDSERGEMVSKDDYYANRQESNAPMIMGDIQPYKSGVTGELISSRGQHKAHLKQHGMVEVAGEEKYLQKVRENKKLEAHRHRREQIIDIVVNQKYKQGR